MGSSYDSCVDGAVRSPLTGIVRDCLELALDPGESRVFCVVAEATHPERFHAGASPCARYGCGVGLTVEQATQAAVGEVLERYCASIYDPALLVHARFEELGEAAVPPERFALFSAQQYAAFANRAMPRPFVRATRTGWVHGFNLMTGSPVLVPAAFVYLPYRYGDGEPFISDSFSTGLACARSRDEATLSALCEVVERDALAIIWHSRLSLSALPVACDRRLSCGGVRSEILDATLDIRIPTVIAHLDIDRGGSTILTSATHPQLAVAAHKAMLEAIQCRISWKRELIHGTRRQYADEFVDITRFSEHAELYTLHAMRPHVEFLWAGGEDVVGESVESVEWPGDTTARTLQRCISTVRDAGFEAIAIDVTTDDVREAGYWVVRVIVPGLQPLYARQDAPFLGGARLRHVAHALGRRSQPLEESALNRFVHPFP
jgi:ribosomal protein S12 methylthiotransferase accessory factor